jgi:hypothetical protein
VDARLGQLGEVDAVRFARMYRNCRFSEPESRSR